MHSEEAKIVDLVGEHLQTKEKNYNVRGRVGDLLPPPLKSVF
jgi:hypothetical protein